MILEKEEEQVSLNNMRIKALWECSYEDDKVGAKQIVDIKRFQNTSCEPIPPLDGKLGELIELDDEILKEPMVASLTEVDIHVQDLDEKNNEDTLIAM